MFNFYTFYTFYTFCTFAFIYFNFICGCDTIIKTQKER